MNRFKIKIEQKNNGQIDYTPMVGTPMISLFGLNLFYRYEYIYDIRKEVPNSIDPDNLSTTTNVIQWYETVEKCERVIKAYKQLVIKKEGKRIKSTKYIKVK